MKSVTTVIQKLTALRLCKTRSRLLKLAKNGRLMNCAIADIRYVLNQNMKCVFPVEGGMFMKIATFKIKNLRYSAQNIRKPAPDYAIFLGYTSRQL